MEKLNKYFVFGGIILIIGVICIATGIKLYSNHLDRVYLVFDKSIEEAAVLCFNEKKCNSEVLIEELETLEYIDKAIDPNTKKHLSKLSVTIKDNQATINY